MSELVERYVHQVGRYLPPSERADIEAELRSQIQDQLDDRYAEAPTQEQVASVLAEMGHPYMIAASYSGEQYLVGPLLYPYLMMVLRRVWLIVPAVVVFLSIFGTLISSEPINLITVLLETAWAVLQATLMLTSVVVLFFAILQHTYMQRDDQTAFNPLELPEADDPGVIDRFETLFSAAFGVVVILILMYFLRVGGLTLRFDLSDPGAVIPSSPAWMIVLIVSGIGQIVLNLLALRNRRWEVGMLLGETALEMLGTIALYFAVTKPLVERLLVDQPHLADVIFIARAPEIFAVMYAVITLISRGTTLVRLWGYREGGSPPF